LAPSNAHLRGKAERQCTLSAHHHLSHSNTIHAKPHLFTGIRNVS